MSIIQAAAPNAPDPLIHWCLCLIIQGGCPLSTPSAHSRHKKHTMHKQLHSSCWKPSAQSSAQCIPTMSIRSKGSKELAQDGTLLYYTLVVDRRASSASVCSTTPAGATEINRFFPKIVQRHTATLHPLCLASDFLLHFSWPPSALHLICSWPPSVLQLTSFWPAVDLLLSFS